MNRQRIIAAPQLDRVELEHMGQLVHRALQCEQERHLRRRAHRPRRIAVDAAEPFLAGHRLGGIQRGRYVRAFHREIVKPRAHRRGVVPDREQPSVARGAEADAMAGFGAVVGDGELVAAADLQPNRPAQPARGERADGAVLGQGELGAEMAADEVGDHPHLLRPNPELRCQAVLRGGDVAGRLVHGQRVAFPGAGRARQLDRVVVLDRRRVATVQRHRRRRERSLEIALAAITVLGTDVGQRLRLAARIGQRGDRRLAGVGDAHGGCRGDCRLRRLRHHQRDDLAGVAHFGRGERPPAAVRPTALHQVADRADRVADLLVGENEQHAGHRPRGGAVDAGDPPAGDRADHKRGMRHVRQDLVAREVRSSADLERTVDPLLRLSNYCNGAPGVGTDTGLR